VATAWTETEVSKNMARCNVFEAVKAGRAHLPFPLLGIDNDNGGEFINEDLRQYCEDEHIAFTRSCPYRKNDNCYVEEKNNSIVRHLAGYYRYDTPEQLDLLRGLYQVARLYSNFFLTLMKLKDKVRNGSKLTRRYDEPQSPYKRVLAHPRISREVKSVLTRQYESHNLVLLKRHLNRIPQALFTSAIKAGPPPRPPARPPYPPPDHPWRGRSTGRGTRAASPPAGLPGKDEPQPP
jgi:hypothetical protein